MDNQIAQSPLPGEVLPAIEEKQIITMDFSDAMRAIILGKRIRRLEWQEVGVYCLLNGNFLSIHKADGKNYQWLVTDGDMFGIDWVTID